MFETKPNVAEAPELGPSKIELPENSELENMLKTKLESYKVRLVGLLRERREIRDDGFKAPEQLMSASSTRAIFDTEVKIETLSALLENGTVTVDNVFNNLKDRGIAVDEGNLQHLKEAFAVIQDYIETGGKNVKGGSLN